MIIKHLKIIFFPIILICTLYINIHSFAEETTFAVRRIGQIVGFTKNTFSVDAPESGTLTIKISTDLSVFRTIEKDVSPGNSKIEWDGLGYNQEKLQPMKYHICATLKGVSGEVYEVSFDSPVSYCSQAMQFALSSSETVYLSDPKEWFIETKVIMDGTLTIELYPENSDAPLYTFHPTVLNGRINKLSFAAIVGKTMVSPGTYRLHIYEQHNPDFFSDIQIQVRETKPEKPEVSVTGSIMPERDASDEEIWDIMMQPAVVVDIRSSSHQNVYSLPDETSESMGTLHGQTQSVRVISIFDEWAQIEAWNHEEGELINGWVPLEKLKTEIPRTEYGLLIDKKAQTLTVFRKGKRIETIMVCTGRMEKNALYQETTAGSFLTGEHRVDYSTNGKKYDYVIQYDGGNLIHQIPYAFGENKKDFSEGRSLLGAKGSHACIRVQAEPGCQSGINAYWLWTHIPYHTRVIILDDPEERHKAKAILEGKGAIENTIFSSQVNEKDGRDTIVLTFGGDAVLGGRESYYNKKESFMSYVAENGMKYPFSGINEFFASDDLTSVNLECVLKSDKSGEDMKKQWRFRGLPEYNQILVEGSVELVNLANNHTYDYGEEGFQSTIQALENSTTWCGNGQNTVIMVKGYKLGFGGCRETAYKKDPGIISRDIQQLMEEGCQFIVYQCHWGTEYDYFHNAVQEAMARACVRAGANLVIGHHPHVVQGIDYIENVPVIYSLGNLCFGGTIQLSGYDAILARAEIVFSDNIPNLSIHIIPVLTSSRGDERINDYHPVAATGEDADRIIQLVQNDSGILVPK